jgi:hypothetical protein
MAVRRFIRDAPPGLVLTPDPVVAKTIDLKTKAPPAYVEKMREQMEEGLDVLTEKERLYYVQKERLMRMIEHEKEAPPVSLKSIRYEIELADKMLTELGKFQMDLGVVKRVPMAADIRMLQRAEVDVGRNMLQILMAKGLDVEGILAGGVVDAEGVKLLTEPGGMKKVLREGLIDGTDKQD